MDAEILDRKKVEKILKVERTKAETATQEERASWRKLQ